MEEFKQSCTDAIQQLSTLSLNEEDSSYQADSGLISLLPVLPTVLEAPRYTTLSYFAVCITIKSIN